MAMTDFVTGTYGTMYYVRDMKKAVQYYTDILGKGPEDESPEWTTFDLNGTKICLHVAEAGAQIDGKGVLIMNTKNLKDAVPALKAMGVEIYKDYTAVCEGGYSVDIKDPSGNILSFFEYTGN
jgi:predicted enzyme related to lactoylglutathione lyase